MPKRKTTRKKRVKTLHFKSKKNYHKWLAFNFIHNPKEMLKKPNKRIYIRGKLHKVNHKRRR